MLTSIYLASSPSVEDITGEYFYDSHVVTAAPQAADRVVARKLWDVSAKMVHLADGLVANTKQLQMETVQTGVNSEQD